jgi:hypothetical protein
MVAIKATTWNPNQYQNVSKWNQLILQSKNPKPEPKIEGSKREIKHVKKWNNKKILGKNEML